MTTQSLQQTLTKTWHSRIGRVVGVSLSLVLLGIAVISYRAANLPTSVDRTSSTRSEVILRAPVVSALRSMGSADDRHSDELIPECMVHVCVQRPVALVAEQNMDELIPECMVQVCVQRRAAPNVDRNIDELIPECMIHICVQPLPASVYAGR